MSNDITDYVVSFRDFSKKLPPLPGKSERQIKCIKCGQIGHIMTDKSCPLSSQSKIGNNKNINKLRSR